MVFICTVIHSFIFSNRFILVGVSTDPEPIRVTRSSMLRNSSWTGSQGTIHARSVMPYLQTQIRSLGTVITNLPSWAAGGNQKTQKEPTLTREAPIKESATSLLIPKRANRGQRLASGAVIDRKGKAWPILLPGSWPWMASSGLELEITSVTPLWNQSTWF